MYKEKQSMPTRSRKGKVSNLNKASTVSSCPPYFNEEGGGKWGKHPGIYAQLRELRAQEEGVS